MTREDMLAGLVAQAQESGGPVTVRAIIEEASELGAARALVRIGLGDDNAGGDIAELRELLGAWRDAKQSAWKAFVGWVVRGMLALLLIGFAVRFGFSEALR